MTLPNAWQNADILDGLDIEDKSKLVGVPFLITGCQFKPSNDNVNICYVDGEYVDGTGFTFTDSSTGVRAQLIAYLAEKKQDHIVDSGEYLSFRIVAPNGLRVSEYDRPIRTGAGPVTSQALRQQPQKVKTYYLTTSGRRAAREEAGKPTSTRRTAPAK